MMFKTVVILFIFIDISNQCCNIVEDSELVMALLVHRHGDRTPEKSELTLSDDPYTLAKMSEVYGYGQLTDIGKARSYILGKFFRRRYGKFLSPSYNPSDISVRCSNIRRTQDTAAIAITAAYSPKELWSEGMALVPFNCTIASMSLDITRLYYEMLKLKLNDQAKFGELLNALAGSFRFNKTDDTTMDLYTLFDLLTFQQSSGMPLSDLDRQLMPALHEAIGVAMNSIVEIPSNVPSEASDRVLQEFFDVADSIMSGADVPRLRVFSEHDLNVCSLVAASRAVPKQGLPGYCSAYCLELRKCKYNGELVVVPIYVKSPEEPEAYLEIEQCGAICNYQKFRDLIFRNVTEPQYGRWLLATATHYPWHV